GEAISIYKWRIRVKFNHSRVLIKPDRFLPIEGSLQYEDDDSWYVHRKNYSERDLAVDDSVISHAEFRRGYLHFHISLDDDHQHKLKKSTEAKVTLEACLSNGQQCSFDQSFKLSGF
ncbi:MAG: hypothetical protein ACREQN_08975, partial [Candidatus Binataceae bacterium]